MDLAVDAVSHPMRGRRLPDLPALLARCDDDARPIFELACGLARRRYDQTCDHAAHLDVSPWSEPRAVSFDAVAPRWCKVTPSDLLRALLATDEHVVEIALHSDERSMALAAIVAHWQREAAACTRRDHLSLEDAFARRWALDVSDAPIDHGTLFDSLPLRSLRELAALAGRYSDGLVTLGESLNALFDHGAGRRRRIPVEMPAAYWDRRQLLDQLDQRVATGPGVVIVGPANSGRHALIRAWGERLRSAGPPALRRHGFNIDNEHGGGIVEWRGEPVFTLASIDTRCIYVSSRFGREVDPALDLRPDVKRHPAYVLDFASNPANDFRLIAVMTSEELAIREAQLPGLRALPRLEVPAIDDLEVLPIWICQLPALEDQFGRTLSLARVIDRLAWRAPDRWRDFATHRDLAVEEALSPAPDDPDETVERHVASYVSHAHVRGAARSSRVISRLVQRSPTLAALIGDTARFDALLAIDDMLRAWA